MSARQGPGSITCVRGPPGRVGRSLCDWRSLSIQDQEVLVAHLTVDRLRSYLELTYSDVALALSLYQWNSAISSEMFHVLGDVEIVLRNTMDREIQKLNVTLGNQGDWFDELDIGISWIWREQVNRARVYLMNDGKLPTHSNVVAELNFGFWRSFLSRQYKDTLWREALRFAFPHSPSRQPEYIFTRVRHLHVLRNRIAHHEPIHQRDLARDYQTCLEVLSAISPVIAEWSAKNSRVLQVLAHRPL